MNFNSLKPNIKAILQDGTAQIEKKLTSVCEYLKTEIDYYDWVGFYFAHEENHTLHLKAFAGEPTNHKIIPFGKGICGQVAVSNKNFVVPNVNNQDNYIACSLTVQSEIVIPLFKDGKNIGQIDIDSNSLDPFTEKDERFLEWVNKKVASIL